MKTDKIELEEDVICTSMVNFLTYRGKIYIPYFQKFLTLTVLSGYVYKYLLIGRQTQGNVYKDIW